MQDTFGTVLDNTILANSYYFVTEMLATAKDEVRLSSPYLSLPVAQKLAALASSSSASWSFPTALDPFAIANGYLSVQGLAALLDAGVMVRTAESLHAKVYLADDVGVVGSANLTMSGLGAGVNSNLELSVGLRATQVAAAKQVFLQWWRGARVVDHQSLKLAKAAAGDVLGVVPPKSASGGDDDEMTRKAVALLGEARRVNLWVKAHYGDDAAHDWFAEHSWIASSRGKRPSFKVGDLVLIYAGDLHACYAIVQITSEARYDPGALRDGGYSHEDSRRWSWVNTVEGRLQVGALAAVSPSDLGFTGRGLRNGHRRIDLTEFAAAVRHLATGGSSQ